MTGATLRIDALHGGRVDSVDRARAWGISAKYFEFFESRTWSYESNVH
jgi:hypothetical protein